MGEGPAPYRPTPGVGIQRLLPRSPWYQGWNVIAVCLLCNTVTVGVGFSSFTFFAERWIVEFEVARSNIAIAIMLCSFGGALIAPFAGRFFDKASIRLLVAAGLVIHAAGLFLLSFAQASWQIIAVYAVLLPFGLVLSTNLPSQVLAVRWFPTRRGLALGIAASGSSLAGILMPPTVSSLIDRFGWQSTLHIAAGITAALLLPLVLLVVSNGPGSSSKEPAAQETTPASTQTQVTTAVILRTANFWKLMALSILTLGVVAGVEILLVAYGAERGVARIEVAALFSTLAIATVGSNFLAGFLADRVEHRMILAAVGFAGACAYTGLAFAHGFVPVVLLFVLLGVSLGGLLPMVGASLARQFGTSALGRAYGLAAAILAVQAVFAPLIARIHELLDSFVPVMLGCAVLTACAGALALTMKYPRPQAREAAP